MKKLFFVFWFLLVFSFHLATLSNAFAVYSLIVPVDGADANVHAYDGVSWTQIAGDAELGTGNGAEGAAAFDNNLFIGVNGGTRGVYTWAGGDADWHLSGGASDFNSASTYRDLYVWGSKLYLGTIKWNTYNGGGVYEYSNGTWTKISDANADGDPLLSPQGVEDFVDLDGNLFVVTRSYTGIDDGCFTWDGTMNENGHYNWNQIGSAANDFNSAWATLSVWKYQGTLDDMAIYVGTGGGKVFRYDGQGGWEKVLDSTDLGDATQVLDMVDYDGNLWIATLGGTDGVYTFHRTGSTSPPSNYVTLSASCVDDLDSCTEVNSLFVWQGRLYAGTGKADDASVFEYYNGTWQLVGDGTNDFLKADDIWQMAAYDTAGGQGPVIPEYSPLTFLSTFLMAIFALILIRKRNKLNFFDE